MNGIITVRRDEIQNSKANEFENVIRLPKVEKSLSIINKLVIGVLIICLTIIVFSLGQQYGRAHIQPAETRDKHIAQNRGNNQLNKKVQGNPSSFVDKERIVEKEEDSLSQKINDQNPIIDHESKDKSSVPKNIPEDNVEILLKEDTIKLVKVNNDDDEVSGNGHLRGKERKEVGLFLKQNAVNEDTILWGHYKSHLIYNLSQKKNNPLSMSMSYIPDMNSQPVFIYYKQKSNQRTVFYDFKYNDGVNFSEFLIEDHRYDYKVESIFIKQKADLASQQWVTQHTVHKQQTTSQKQNSLIFSFSKEIYDIKSMGDEGIFYHFQSEIIESAIYVDVYSLKQNDVYHLSKESTKFIGQFVFTILKDNQIVQGRKLKEILRFSQVYQPKAQLNWNIEQTIHSNFYTGKELNNKEIVDSTVNCLLIQFIFDSSQEYIVQLSFSSAKNRAELQKEYPFQKVLAKLINQYEKQIKSSIESKGIYDNHNCTVFALSNLLGGMTYKFGELQYTQQEEQKRSTPKSIFSFTPSRTRFGWSFLWDDGFHNTVASKFQPKLSSFVIKSWLDSMNEQGWICREQNRGEEAQGLCSCPDFIKKDNRDGNPPSLILTLEYFLRDHQNMMNEEYFEKIEKWYHWYLRSQMVKDELFKGNSQNFTDVELNSFVFKYWDRDSSQQSMNSGLDDFPRNDYSNQYSSPIGHIDAQSWMYHFTSLMERLSIFNQDIAKVEYYQILKETILSRAEEYFLDDADLLYKDILSSKGSLSSITYSPHFGYPNLLPLAFGMVKDNRFELNNLINRIKNPDILWTEYGLRSLSKSDSFFKKGNNYWTGPIWIQMNYLVLRGLKLYYHSNQEATQLYRSLRENVMKTVCSNWEKTGFFYENYNKDGNGYGSDAFPFTGWTATVALINAENY